MTDTIIATRATIAIGSLTVDGFMLPDGSYRMSLSQAAESVNLAPRNAFDFFAFEGHQKFTGQGLYGFGF